MYVPIYITVFLTITFILLILSTLSEIEKVISVNCRKKDICTESFLLINLFRSNTYGNSNINYFIIMKYSAFLDRVASNISLLKKNSS